MDRPKTIIKENQETKVPGDWTAQMRLDTYRDMAKHVGSSGPVRALGVCNFSLRYPLFEKETITKDFRLKEITSWKFFLVRRLTFLF